jgi:phage-related protein (TIGR01555 family)
MTLFDRLRSLFVRADAAPPVTTTALVHLPRADVAPMPDVGALTNLFRGIGRRADALYNLLSGQGNPLRDKASANRPVPGHRLSYEELDILYEEQGYARRLVSEIVHDATRKGWSVMTGKEEDAEQRALDEELGLMEKIKAAATMGRKDGGAWLWVVFDDNPTREQLAEPPKNPTAILNLIPLDPLECTAYRWESDPTNKSFSYPSHYQISPTQQGGDARFTGAVVHASRLLYFRGLELTRRRRLALGHDLSVLQNLWDKIAALESADKSLSGFLHENNTSWMKIAGMGALSLSDQSALVELRLRELSASKGAIGTVFMDEHDEFGVVSRSAAGLDGVHDRLKEALAGVSGMPLSRLFGEAPGGLNADGESQASNWREQVASYQRDVLAPQLERYYKLAYLCRGGEPEDWTVAFAPLDEPTEAQRSQIRKTEAETDALYFDRGVITAEEIRAARFGPRPHPIVVEGDAPDEDDEDDVILLDAADKKPRPPTKAMIEELKRGLAWHEEGLSGDGLKPETVAWARRMAAGEPPSLQKLLDMGAWLARHEVDKQSPRWSDPSPGRVAWALWAGDAGKSYVAAEKKRLGLE